MKRNLLILMITLMLLVSGCTLSTLVSPSETFSGELSYTSTNSSSIVPADDLSQDWSGLTDRNNGGITTIGLYTWDDNPSQHAFLHWKDCRSFEGSR